VSLSHPLVDIDPRLPSEAFRRARERRSSDGVDSASLLSADIAEARRGARDLYALVRAAESARPPGAARSRPGSI
jgi:hypothetical protein